MNRLELRAWRRQRWLRQSDLADLLGVYASTIVRWEGGETTVPPFLHLALAELDHQHRWSPDGVDGRLRGAA